MQPVIIKRQRVALGPDAQSPARSTGCAAPGHRPEVRVIEDQGLIAALEVLCSCGCLTLIELCYPEDGEVQP